MVSDQLSGSTETTWSEALGVDAPLTGVTRGTFEAVFEAKEGFLTDGLDDEWSGCVGTASRFLRDTEQKNNHHQKHDVLYGGSISTVEVQHL